MGCLVNKTRLPPSFLLKSWILAEGKPMRKSPVSQFLSAIPPGADFLLFVKFPLHRNGALLTLFSECAQSSRPEEFP